MINFYFFAALYVRGKSILSGEGEAGSIEEMVYLLHFLRIHAQQNWALSPLLGLLEAILRLSQVLKYSFASEDFTHLIRISWKQDLSLVRQI